MRFIFIAYDISDYSYNYFFAKTWVSGLVYRFYKLVVSDSLGKYLLPLL